MSKIIVVEGCDEEYCPYCKRTHHYDYNDKIRCSHSKRNIYNNIDHEPLNEFEWIDMDDVKHKPNCGDKGLFPKDCPLKDN